MNTNQQADRTGIAPGWHLHERYYLEVMKHGGTCLFCDEVAGWKWEEFDSSGARIRWLQVCAKHKTRLRPSDSDPFGLELNIPSFPRSKSVTREELLGYLSVSDQLFPTSTPNPMLLHGFPELTHLELMERLQEIEAVEPSENAAGWVVRNHFLVALRHDDGSWEAIVKRGAGMTRITQTNEEPNCTTSEEY
jgi:hypothetical protein